MKCPVFARFLLVALAALAAPSRVYAVTIDKADNVLDLNQTGSWVGGVLPGTSDVARWNDLVTVAGPFGISSPGVEYGGIVIEDPSGPWRPVC
jgi:hypothetical protein